MLKITIPLVLLAIGCSHTQNIPQTDNAITTISSDIKNFQTVEPDLYRGGRLTAANIRFLSQVHHVKTIISFETYWNAPEVKQIEIETAKELGINLIHVPMNPVGDINADFVWKAVDLVAKEQRPLYFHCYRGSERTGLVAAGYRMKYENWTYKQATDEMDKYGFSPHYKEWKNILPNPNK